MVEFQQRTITHTQIVGEILQAARKEQHFTQDQVAEALHIRVKYVEAIERSNYRSLPSGLFIRHYVQRYTRLLRLNQKTVNQLLEAELKVYHQQAKIPTLTQHLVKRPLKIFQVVSVCLIILLVLIVGVYVLGEVNNIIQPPLLTLATLPAQVPASQPVVQLSGKTIAQATVTVNGQTILVNNDGTFDQAMPLQPGVNIFKIVAKTVRSQEHVVYAQVILATQPVVQSN